MMCPFRKETITTVTDKTLGVVLRSKSIEKFMSCVRVDCQAYDRGKCLMMRKVEG